MGVEGGGGGGPDGKTRCCSTAKENIPTLVGSNGVVAVAAVSPTDVGIVCFLEEGRCFSFPFLCCRRLCECGDCGGCRWGRLR